MEELWVTEGKDHSRRRAKKTTCKNCQNEFLQRLNGSAIYCGISCRMTHRSLLHGEKRTCSHCNKEFCRAKSKSKGTIIFCNKACRDLYFVARKKSCKGSCDHCKNPINIGKYCNKKCEQLHRLDICRHKMKAGKKIFEGTAKKILLIDRGHQCERCGLSEWQNEKIPLDLHHKNGDYANNLPSNLQLLCKNCHALTENYGIRNKGRGRTKRQYMRYKQKIETKGQ